MQDNATPKLWLPFYELLRFLRLQIYPDYEYRWKSPAYQNQKQSGTQGGPNLTISITSEIYQPKNTGITLSHSCALHISVMLLLRYLTNSWLPSFWHIELEANRETKNLYTPPLHITFPCTISPALMSGFSIFLTNLFMYSIYKSFRKNYYYTISMIAYSLLTSSSLITLVT